MSEKKKIVIKFIGQPICETCGKLVQRNQRILFLFNKIYHYTCGYNN